MRKALLSVLSYLPLLAAENPFIGTWKENCDKSIATLPGCVSQVILIEPVGESSVKISDEFTTPAGEKQHSTGVHSLDGSEVHPTGTEPDFAQSFRRISPNVWERTAKRPGDVRHGYWAVSRDGKVLIITGFGKDPKGQEYYFHRVLDWK